MAKLIARPLSGLYVGLSISESGDSANRGFPPWQVNHVTLQVATALLGQGAGIVFGHDWREDGVMEAVHAIALRMQSHLLGPTSESRASPLLKNFLPWPDTPSLSRDEQNRLAATLHVEQAGLPPDVQPVEQNTNNQLPDAYRRARALTHMRRMLTENIQARVCIGGRTTGSKGRYPGIVEEALLSVEARQPLFLIGLLGGATQHVIEAVSGAPIPSIFSVPDELTQFYQPGQRGRKKTSDREIAPKKVWSTFRTLGVAGLAASNGLTEAQNLELFTTPSIERAIHLVLIGLARHKKKSTGATRSRKRISPA